jgi:predicted  nucleic acid-binding Zn-ribbon protein
MQLAPMRYSKIDGTAVAVSVKSALEAKAAVKELRHKKRELKFLRAALSRRLQAVRPKPARRRSRMQSSLVEAATVAREERRARDPEEIEREMHNIDETLHNIEGCILQLQGKLLTLG